MKELIKKFLGPKEVAAIKSYLRAVLASAVTMGLALLMDMQPEHAILIGGVTAPLAKWADRTETQYGLGSEEQPFKGPSRPIDTRNPPS